jgi:hypothetical protein
MMDVIWHAGTVSAVFTTDRAVFHVRRVKDKCVLLVTEEPERVLIALRSDDPQMGNRVLVAMGDEIDEKMNAIGGGTA